MAEAITRVEELHGELEFLERQFLSARESRNWVEVEQVLWSFSWAVQELTSLRGAGVQHRLSFDEQVPGLLDSVYERLHQEGYPVPDTNVLSWPSIYERLHQVRQRFRQLR